MFRSFKNRNLTFILTLFCVLALGLFLGVQITSACGAKGCKKACASHSSGKDCPMHSSGASSGGTHEGASAMSQAPSLDDFGKTKLYTCPMHPEVREKKSGKCPHCGMKLEKQEFYKVYTCSHPECPRISVKDMKCCEKGMERKAMTKQEYYDLTRLQEEYFCPMHSDVVSNQAGKCPKCGMNLELRTVPRVEEKTEAK